MTAVMPKLDPSAVTPTPQLRTLKSSPSPVRRESRTDEVRIAQYTPFPRASATRQPRVGFTRDVSSLGMCLGVDHPEPIGALLKIDVRRLDGQSMGASIARVVWCAEARDGRHWIGLDLMCETHGKRPALTAPSGLAEGSAN
ncbi:MAG: hypothetical protein AAEJ52_09220 [Myxococcota bacterium]